MLPGEHFFSRWSQGVIAAPALALLLYPSSADPATVLHPVKNRVQGRDPDLQLAARATLQQLADLVPVTRLSLEDGEDQELEASPFELGIEDGWPLFLVGARWSARDEIRRRARRPMRDTTWRDTSCHVVLDETPVLSSAAWQPVCHLQPAPAEQSVPARTSSPSRRPPPGSRGHDSSCPATASANQAPRPVAPRSALARGAPPVPEQGS